MSFDNDHVPVGEVSEFRPNLANDERPPGVGPYTERGGKGEFGFRTLDPFPPGPFRDTFNIDPRRPVFDSLSLSADRILNPPAFLDTASTLATCPVSGTSGGVGPQPPAWTTRPGGGEVWVRVVDRAG